MTLEEAIKILDGKAEYWESKARKKNDGTMSTMLFNEEQAKVYRQGAEWLRELKEFKVLFVKANRDVGNVHLDNRAIFEKFFWEVWKILDVKGLEEVNADDSIGTD